MSTRSEILIKDYGTYEGKKWNKKVKLYHHHDGYPEGVGKFLVEEVLSKLKTSNGYDCDSIANFLIKHKEDEEYEVTAYYHPDIEYFYEIDIPCKQVKCWKVRYKNWDVNKLTKIQEISLTPFETKDSVSVSYS